MIRNLEFIRLENMKQCGFGIETMKRIKVCVKCGKTSTVENEFCTECGYKLGDKSLYDIYKERHKVCPNCDTVLTDEAEYCPQCGVKINILRRNLV